MSTSLLPRVLVAGAAIPTVLLVVYLGGWMLASALAVVGALGAREIYRLAKRQGAPAVPGLGVFGAAAAPILLLESVRRPHAWLAYAAIGWMLVVMLAAVFRRSPQSQPLHGVAVSVFGALYAGLLPAFMLVIREQGAAYGAWGATWLVFLPLVVIWVCDSMAMAGGSLIGGPKLAPVISPNKTWAGAVSGSLFGTIVAPIYGWLLLDPVGITLPWWQLALFGLVVSALGQVGDLAESLFKRAAGVKDSGTLLPGHGGVLDRLDSLYWALPVAAWFLTLYGTV